ncbi:MAG: aldo/keto reductase [Epsilonproteobacteria bacterium]|nr:aldo/keto reductase [Campylobacterota bacterium]
MSNFAFGTYRISDLNPQHIQALKDAMASGIKMIDTSHNYMDGGAEKAIGIALQEISQDRKEIEILSKYKASQDLTQCLELSLKRLKTDYIDCYMVENIEEFLVDAVDKNISKDERLDAVYEKIYDAFLALELAVKEKKILSYGISSDSFAQKVSSEYFLPYEDLISIADRASQEAGNENYNLTTIELPINILEVEGLKCAKWAKERSLRVLSNRALNAQFDSKMYRLAEYDEPFEYYHNLNELLELCDNDELRVLYNLIQELDVSKHKFGWIGDYDSFFYTQILPHIKSTLDIFDDKTKENMLTYIDNFFTDYRKMVLFECTNKTKESLKPFFNESILSIQEYAIKFLLDTKSIDFIVVGMRKPSYVYEILALK